MSEDLLFISDIGEHCIHQVLVEKRLTFTEYKLSGSKLLTIPLTLMQDGYGLAYKDDSLFVSGHATGILHMNLNTNEVKRI